MVKEIEHKGKKFFQCESCEMCYKEPKLAEKCENFCEEHRGGSIEITKHAVEIG